MNLRNLIVFLSIGYGVIYALGSDAQDTVGNEKIADSVQNISYNKISPEKDVIIKNPLTAGAISALIPGGGQIYTGNFIRSGTFFASEAIIGLIGYSRYVQRLGFQKNSALMLDSTNIFYNFSKNAPSTDDSIRYDSIAYRYGMFYGYNRFLERDNRYFYYQSLSWMFGFYYWNILDALKNSNFFKNDKPKNPSTAGWLAAIPGLGLGQFYNGELSKAGFIFCVQMNMAYMIYNYNKLMRICEDALNNSSRFNTLINNKYPAAVQLKTNWDSKRNEAFRNRNMWLWYSVAFYLYGIFDAVVDAHLHDAATKMKLEPDLLPEKKQIGLSFKTTF